MSLKASSVQSRLGIGVKIPSKRTILILVALVIAGFCVSLTEYIRAMQSVRWPTAPGIISVSRLQVEYFKQLKGYWPDIQYDYRVKGTQFHGTRISFNRVSGAVEEASRPILNSYPVGKVVSVYYDPKHPDFAVLKPGLHGEILITFYLAVFFIVFSIAGFVWLVFYDW